MTKLTSISNLKAGTVLRVGYRAWVPTENDTFLGFRFEGGETLYPSKRDAALSGKDMNDLRAVFAPHGAGRAESWEAYRYNGRWCVGSSADGAKLFPAAA
jgi:hypothetical protein